MNYDCLARGNSIKTEEQYRIGFVGAVLESLSIELKNVHDRYITAMVERGNSIFDGTAKQKQKEAHNARIRGRSQGYWAYYVVAGGDPDTGEYIGDLGVVACFRRSSEFDQDRVLDWCASVSKWGGEKPTPDPADRLIDLADFHPPCEYGLDLEVPA